MNPTYKILVVDDERAIVTGMLIRLKMAGFEAVAAYNGTDALAELKQAPPHLIITDLRMPGMDGLQLLKIIRGDDETKHIPVVLCTGCRDDRQPALAAGASGVLIKPFQKDELLESVNTLLMGQTIGET